jgi:hypothetical protein
LEKIIFKLYSNYWKIPFFFKDAKFPGPPREEPKQFSGLITLFLLVARGSKPQEHSLICA